MGPSMGRQGFGVLSIGASLEKRPPHGDPAAHVEDMSIVISLIQLAFPRTLLLARQNYRETLWIMLRSGLWIVRLVILIACGSQQDMCVHINR